MCSFRQASVLMVLEVTTSPSESFFKMVSS